MKTLKLSENKALELYKTASKEFKEILEETFGIDFFKPKDITDRVKDLDSLLDYLNLKKDELLHYPNPKSDLEKYINACIIIPEVVKIYNQGIILDWSNSNQYKYLPYIRMLGSSWVAGGSGGWGSGAYGPLAHHFKSRELSYKALKNFNQIYLDYYTYKG